MRVDWFDRGRDAFTQGKECFISDARISGACRERWYQGWRHQRNLNTTPASEEDRADAIAGVQDIKNSLSGKHA